VAIPLIGTVPSCFLRLSGLLATARLGSCDCDAGLLLCLSVTCVKTFTRSANESVVNGGIGLGLGVVLGLLGSLGLLCAKTSTRSANGSVGAGATLVVELVIIVSLFSSVSAPPLITGRGGDIDVLAGLDSFGLLFGLF